MRLKLPEIVTEASAEFENTKFGFGNESLIMEILRGKMYSNPISTICQEYMSNARDAHREIGNEHRPIEITLPNKLDPNLYIRDFGPGITPDRMANIYVLYGNSTKREDDEETGGFGLGSKCGFSYNDTFTVVSITGEGTLTKRTYVAFLDETRLGQMSLVDEGATEEERGTTIIVAAKPGDYNQFAEHVKRVGEWWDPRPIIKGSDAFQWSDIPIIQSGLDQDWVVNHNYYRNQIDTCKAILDGIPYDLNLNHIFPAEENGNEGEPIPQWARSLFSISLRLIFRTGDLPVTANRESIDYTPEAIEVLQGALQAVYDEVNFNLEFELYSATNLLEANMVWKEIKSRFDWLDNMAVWKGKPLTTKLTIPTAYSHWNQNDKTKLYHWVRMTNGPEYRKRSRYKAYQDAKVEYRKNILFVEDDTDTKTPSKNRIYTLFDQHPDVSDFYIVKWACKSQREKVEKSHAWSDLGIVYLSNIEKTFKRSKGVKSLVSKIKVWKGFWSPHTADLIQDSGIYVTQYKGDMYVGDKDEDEIIILDTDVPRIKREFGKEVYAVIARYTKKLGPGWTTLKEFIQEKLVELEANPQIVKYREYDHKGSMRYDYYYDIWNWAKSSKFCYSIEDQQGVFYRYLTLSRDLDKIQDKINQINFWRGTIGQKPVSQPNKELSKLKKEFDKLYPLLKSLRSFSSWDKKTKSTYQEECAFYINQKDKAQKGN